eukprot:gene15616-6898_t
MKIFVEERYGSEIVGAYRIDPLQNGRLTALSKNQNSGRTKSFLLRLRRLLTTVFLPQGYPESVSEDYLEYQIWDTAQAFCSSITGTLATRAVLKGYGVGDETATATAATITWMLKDGTGMLGRILFAWSKGLFADILNDMSILLDLVSPLFKGYFTFIACLSGIAKSIVGVAGGATRASLTQHQARRDNMADVSAKDGSQETLVNLMALIAGLIITPLVANSSLLVWVLFAVFTFLHLYSNYKAVSAVVMETVNLPRFHILVSNYLSSLRILTPRDVGRKDPVIRAPGYRITMKLGCKLSQVVKSSNEFKNSITNTFDAKYILRLDLESKNKKGMVKIALHKDITHKDLAECCFVAFVLDALFQRTLKPEIFQDKATRQAVSLLCSRWDSGNVHDPEISWELVAMAQNITSRLFPDFYSGLKRHGWNMNTTQFGSDEWRLDWENQDEDIKVV